MTTMALSEALQLVERDLRIAEAESSRAQRIVLELVEKRKAIKSAMEMYGD